MMFFCAVLVYLFAVFGQVSTELVLEKDVAETVTFDGNELEIKVDNSGGIQGFFILCIKTTDQAASPGCPTGYNHIHFSFVDIPDVKSFKMDRQGKVMMGTEFFTTIKAINFNDDEALEVILKQVPDQSTKVRLLNAVRYVPPESTTTTTEKSSKSATIGITVGVVVGVIVFIIVIAAVIGSCVYCRKKKQKQAVAPPVIVVQKATVEKRDPSPKASIKTEETTKKTSQEPLATPSQPQVPAPKAAPKPESPATVPIPAKSTSTQKPPTPSAESAPPPSAEPATAPPVNSTEPTKTKEDEPSSKPDKNKSLKVEKTQTETPPSPPTPPFGNDPASRAMSKNSAFKEKANLAFNQMANVNKKKYRFKKCDELFGYELLSENITCYGMRFGRLDRHENFVIRLRCKCRPHEVSDLEKDILKRTKEVAVHAADMLIEHLKKELAAYGFEPQSGLQQPDRLWKHIDDESTMTSLFYYMMILVKPSLFKVQRQGVHDKDVEVMPVSMLYCLILDQRNSQTFREDLVILLRCRSNEVLKQAPKDSLREGTFPLHYQALLRMKNPESYIEGRSAKTRSMI